MGQFLHSSATTTHAIRALIQRSQALNAALSRELGINVKTVAKWRQRERVEDARMGPKEARSTTLSPDEEAAVVAFRCHTLLPLDDCFMLIARPCRQCSQTSISVSETLKRASQFNTLIPKS
ncbi:hypothetical protein [Tritonibacter mobilis]|uniref:hypothetical protein n=1 Tax=Tritonibacter mobilis TaxID=379347 RepID=UPI00032710E0